jgi:hypothetical protein
LIDPFLDAIEVDDCQVNGESERSGCQRQMSSEKMTISILHVFEAPLAMGDYVRRLPTIEADWDLAMLFLTLVATSGGLPFARSRASTPSDPFVICGRIVGEGCKNVSVARLLLKAR